VSCESIYDEQIAPLLKQAGEIAAKHDMSFVAQVEYESDGVGVSKWLSPSAAFPTKLVYWASECQGNFDALAMQVMRLGEKIGHQSVVLKILGVEIGSGKEA